MTTQAPPIIVKVQLPLFVTDKAMADIALVYDKANMHITHQPLNQRTRDAMKGDVKAFFSATIASDGLWVLGKRLPEQFW